MVVNAQTPGAQQIPSNASNSTPSTAPQTPDPQTGSETSSLTGVASGQDKVTRHSSSVRLIAAAVCAAAAILAAIVVSFNPGEQPVKLAVFLSAAMCAAVTLTEAITSWIIRRRSHSVFDALPLVGCALITAAAIWESLVTTSPTTSLLIITAPAIAAAALCLGNGLSIMGANAARTDSDYLFPKARAATIQYSLGDSLSLRAGDVVPVDGRIQSGSIGVDERAITPLAAFRIREEQEIVYAGSEVLAGTAQITALSGIKDSCLAQLQSAVAPVAEEAAESLRTEDIRASRWTAFTICFVAAALAIAWKERSGAVSSSLLAAGCVLLLASICQVSEYLYGQRRELTRRWLSRGFLLGFSSSVRDLSRVSRIECDLSRCGPGSLVRGTHLEILDDRLSAPALCDFLASLLGRADDAMLLAAAEYCRIHATKLTLERALDLREYAGRGICGTIHGVELSVGSEDFLVERGIMVQPTDSGLEDDRGEPLLMVAIDDDIVARFWIGSSQEHLFPEADEVGESSDGVELVLSSGVSRELGEETLLVRGTESDLIGQTARHEVGLFSAEEGALRRATVVAFTPDIAPLKQLVRECYGQARSADRLRLMVGFGGLVTVAAVFIGAFTPLIPFAWLALSAIAVRAPRAARGNTGM